LFNILSSIANPRPHRTSATDFCSTAELLVGPSATRFLLHTSLLTNQSPFFRAALQGPFLESTSQSINLDDVSVDVFELCVNWLYTGSIRPIPFKDGKPAYYTLLHLYILADRLCFEGLRNCVVDLMADLTDSTNSVLTPSDTRILYEQIDSSAPVRKLVLDLFAFKKTDKLLKEHEDRWHAGFLRDLVVHLKRPCEQAMLRHKLSMWYPASFGTSRSCEICHAIMTPRHGAVRCEDCCVGWCVRCVGAGVGMAGWEDGNQGRLLRVRGADEGGDADDQVVVEPETGKKVRVRKWVSCKPWRGSRCVVYHEHSETDRCGDVFMGH
jgi:hypothetical protein